MKNLAIPAILLFGALPAPAGHDLELTIPAEKPAGAADPNALKYDTREWYGSTFWTGPDWTRVGKDWHHPGEATPSVRRFACPQDGTVTISGRVFKRHLAGDGVLARILHGDREIWKAQIAGADSDGKSHDLTLAVRKGDSLRFVIDKFKTIACDTTAWDPTITYRDGPAFTASASFAAHKQGADGWYFEMLSDGPLQKATAAMVRAFAPDLSLIAPPFPPASPKPTPSPSPSSRPATSSHSTHRPHSSYLSPSRPTAPSGPGHRPMPKPPSGTPNSRALGSTASSPSMPPSDRARRPPPCAAS